MSTKVYDGFSELRGGMNGDSISSEVGDLQYLKGINVTCRGGIVRTRPPFMGIFLTFANFGDKRIFEKGKFQGCAAYQSLIGTFLVVGVSGNVFLIDPDTGQVANVTTATGRLNQLQDRLYFCQAERYMIVQDGINRAIIMDGLTAAVSDPTQANQVPTGTIMAYGHGRLFIKTAPNEFYCGDINIPTQPVSVLQFTEILTEVPAFSLPGDLGEITGMAFVQNFATGDGAGPLIVFAKNGFDAFAVYNPRSYWGENDISQVQARGIGSASPACVVVTGDDVIVRTYDGIGSYGLFRTSNRRFINMSQELLPFESQETPWARGLSQGALFDNRVLFTLVCEKVLALTLAGDPIEDYRFKGLGSLDLAPLNGLTEISQNRLAVYDGVWTGPNPTGIVTANVHDETRCFVFGKTNEGVNVLYELMTSQGHDCGTIPINCRLYPKEMSFLDYTSAGKNGKPSDTIHQLKRLGQATIFVQRFQDTVEFKLWVSPDRRTDFQLLSEMKLYAPMISTEAPFVDFTSGQVQGRFRKAFPQFNETIGDPVKGITALNAHQYEFCLEWDGIADVRRFGIEAELQDTQADAQPEANKILPMNQRNDFDYVIACPEYLEEQRAGFSNLTVRRGRFNAWELVALPAGIAAIDSNGQWYYPDDLGSGDTSLQFVQDPASSPDWYKMPDFQWPYGETAPSPIPPTTPPPDGSPTIPTPQIKTPDGVMRTGGGPNATVAAKQLPKPGDRPTDVTGVCAELTAQGGVVRGTSFPITVRLRKYTVKYTQDATAMATAKAAYDAAVVQYQAAQKAGDSIAVSVASDAINAAIAAYQSSCVYTNTVYYEDWTKVVGVSALDISLASTDHVQVGTVNGDTATIVTTTNLTWSDTGETTRMCRIDGGTVDPNNCELYAAVTLQDGTIADSNDVPVEIASASSASSVFFILTPVADCPDAAVSRNSTFIMKIAAFFSNGNPHSSYDKPLTFSLSSGDVADSMTPASSGSYHFMGGVMMIPMTIMGGTAQNCYLSITATEQGGSPTGVYNGAFGNKFILAAWGKLDGTSNSPHEIPIPLTGFSVTSTSIQAKCWANDCSYSGTPVVRLYAVGDATKTAFPHVTVAWDSALSWTKGMANPFLVIQADSSALEAALTLEVEDTGSGRIGTIPLYTKLVEGSLVFCYPGTTTPIVDTTAQPGWWNYPTNYPCYCQFLLSCQWQWIPDSRYFSNTGGGSGASIVWRKLTPSDGTLSNLRWTRTLTKTDPNAALSDGGVSAGISFDSNGNGTSVVQINVPSYSGVVTTGGKNTVHYVSSQFPSTTSPIVDILTNCTFTRTPTCDADTSTPLWGGSGPVFTSIATVVPDGSWPGKTITAWNEIRFDGGTSRYTLYSWHTVWNGSTYITNHTTYKYVQGPGDSFTPQYAPKTFINGEGGQSGDAIVTQNEN